MRYELSPYIKYRLILVLKDRIRAQAVSRCQLALGARFRSPASPRGIHVGKSGTVTRVSTSNLLLRCRLSLHQCFVPTFMYILLLVEAHVRDLGMF